LVGGVPGGAACGWGEVKVYKNGTVTGMVTAGRKKNTKTTKVSVEKNGGIREEKGGGRGVG